jgi:predicted DNA-binding ribbon-helix-helix protein
MRGGTKVLERTPYSEIAVKKRSIVLNGQKTSISLEDEFWTALRGLATGQNMPRNELISSIAAGRVGKTNLSSAIRVYVLRAYMSTKGNQTLDARPFGQLLMPERSQ